MSGLYCRFRKDNATSLKLLGKFVVYQASAGGNGTILDPQPNKAMIIDSIYVRSAELNSNNGPLQIELEIFSTTGGATQRPFFVALLDPGETCLAASNSTPVMVDNGQDIRIRGHHKNAAGQTTVNAHVYVSYREYDVV